MRSLALAVVVLLASWSCKKMDASTPVSAYLAFAEAAQRRDWTKAYRALSSSTQAAIKGRVARLQADGGSPSDETAAAFTFANAGQAGGVSEVKLLSQEGPTATVRVTAAGQEQIVQLVQEEASWKVDLTEVLERTP